MLLWGQLFEENISLTSNATRCKLVELIFSAKAVPTKRILGLKWLYEWYSYPFPLLKVKIDLTINLFLHHPIKTKSVSDLIPINRPALLIQNNTQLKLGDCCTILVVSLLASFSASHQPLSLYFRVLVAQSVPVDQNKRWKHQNHDFKNPNHLENSNLMTNRISGGRLNWGSYWQGSHGHEISGKVLKLENKNSSTGNVLE